MKIMSGAFSPESRRLQELLLPGATLYLNEESSIAPEKDLLTVIAVEREGVPVMLHTHRTNQVRYLIENGFIQNLRGAEIIKAEATVVEAA